MNLKRATFPAWAFFFLIVHGGIPVWGLPDVSTKIEKRADVFGDAAVSSLAGLVLWLKSDAGIVNDENGLLRQWSDQSGNQNHAAQANAISRPKRIQEPGDGQPAVRFDGVTNYMDIQHSTSLDGMSNISVFAVVRTRQLSKFNAIVSKASENRAAPFDLYLMPPSGRARFLRGDGAMDSRVHSGLGVSEGEFAIVSAIADGSNGALYVNGIYSGGGIMTTATKDAGEVVRIGGRVKLPTWMWFAGDLAEIILVRRAVSDAERTDIHRYLGEKHGIPVVLGTLVSPPTVRRSAGQSITFAVSVQSSHSRVNYQWQRNGVDIPDATNASYTTPELTLEENNSRFRARVSSPTEVWFSDSAVLTVVDDTEPLTISAASFLLQGNASLKRDDSQGTESRSIAGEENDSASAPSGERAMLSSYNSFWWQPGEDASRNVVQAVAQTADGFLWIGTQGGLARFDGFEFEFVPIGSISNLHLRVNALCASLDGSLWIGSTRGLFQLKNGQWTRHNMPAEVDETILSLCQADDGSLWIGTRTGLAFHENGRFALVDARIPKGQGNAASLTIRSIVENAASKELLAAGPDKLILWKRGMPVESLDLGAFKPDFIRAVCRSRDGSLWAGSNSGLTRYLNGTFTHFSKANGLLDNTVSAVYEDRRGNLWIGTYGGLCRFVEGRFIVETAPEGDGYNMVWCFFEDREDNLWIGSKEGLHRLNAQQFTTYTTRHGLAHNNVISVYEDDEETIWIGTWGGGLHQLRRGKITIYSSAKNKIMRNDLILALHGSRNGGVWFGEDYEGGLYWLKDRDFRHYGRQHGLGRGAIRTLLEDEAGRLWIGSASAYLSVMEKGKFTTYDAEDGLPANSNRCLLQTADGKIWVGTEAGLCFWTQGRFTTLTKDSGLCDDRIFSLFEDKEQTLWIGTGKGLCRMKNETWWEGDRNLKNKEIFKVYAEPSGMPDDAILEILEDDLGKLWLATRNGVVRVSKKDLKDWDAGKIKQVSPANFGRPDGMASQICVGVAKPSAIKSKDGRLWFATTKGLAVTDPRLQIGRNEKPPPVVIQKVTVDRKAMTSDEWRAAGNPSRFPPGRGELEFHYTALSYVAPEKNLFKYKLEGLDREWVDADIRRMAFYNNVPPGNYTFHVIACNNDGIWNSGGASLNISLLPQFWQTWWFRLLLVIGGLTLVAVMARYATAKRMRFKLERLEQQHAVEKERARIARDMHDDLGAQLTGIRMSLDLIKRNKGKPEEIERRAGQASQSVEDTIDKVHAIVWAVNPRNDTVDKLASYLQQYAQSFLEMMTVRFRFDYPEHLPNAPLSSEVRHNVFLVVKEALNNVVKHSGADEVRLRFYVNSGILDVSVEDNGRGLPEAREQFRGNGLYNMRKRMENIGGEFELKSEPGKGTCIGLKIPLGKRNA